VGRGPNFSGAVQIIDLYHARQHLREVARKLHPNGEGNSNDGSESRNVGWMGARLKNCRVVAPAR
jgi:hypothetical protein